MCIRDRDCAIKPITSPSKFNKTPLPRLLPAISVVKRLYSASVFDIVLPVSYTHLDVYKRQGVSGMALLDKANTEAYGNPEITKVNIGVGTNPGILVSGHDLRD